jgi:hypothetical protein
MAKFSTEQFPAGFFDLNQDLARGLPAEIIDQWLHGEPTLERARKLLTPVLTEGTVVSTDCSGLTRLSARMDLLEILRVINQPKELVYGYATCLGGESIGIWAADNTEVLYPPRVPVARILSMLLALIERVRRDCRVEICCAVHYGRYYRLSGGLYGASADWVEQLAEDYTAPGDIHVSSAIAAMAGPEFTLRKRRSLSPLFGKVFRVESGPRAADLDPADVRYPMPFPRDFHSELRVHGNGAPASAGRYLQTRAVVLIEHDHEQSEFSEVAVLNNLAMSMAMRRIGADLLAGLDGREIKVSATTAIFTFANAANALQFAKRFRAQLARSGISGRFGIDFGNVFEFPLEDGLWEIAGLPINVASKMAQDRGELGRIYMTAAAADAAGLTNGMRRMELRVSGVTIEAFVS